ncbi:hypothetical protein ACIOWI_34590 [Streptomyces sp. NPDC087659]|uniref:hypothetical protein n=1 Tax=Streptomyces sp. NPDC087659 TaxID=3365801 RepID=UPI0037FE294A
MSITSSGTGLNSGAIPVIYISVPPVQEPNLYWSLPFAELLGLNHILSPPTAPASQPT